MSPTSGGRAKSAQSPQRARGGPAGATAFAHGDHAGAPRPTEHTWPSHRIRSGALVLRIRTRPRAASPAKSEISPERMIRSAPSITVKDYSLPEWADSKALLPHDHPERPGNGLTRFGHLLNLISADFRLPQDRPERRVLDRSVVRHGQRCMRAIGSLPNHGEGVLAPTPDRTASPSPRSPRRHPQTAAASRGGSRVRCRERGTS